MKVVIVGCGRVGSTLAENLDAMGHEVILFDLRTAAFDRLPETFKGTAVRGDGTDEEVLRQAGAEGADIFLSLTEGDNRNIMSAQVAAENLGIANVIAKINDPVRAAAYADLGLVTLCRTNLMVDAVASFLSLAMKTGPGIERPSDDHDHLHLQVEPTGRGASAGGAATADLPASSGELPVRSTDGGTRGAAPLRQAEQGSETQRTPNPEPGEPAPNQGREPTERPSTPRVFRRWRG